MTRLALAILAATALCGCQHSGQQAIDPFWGRTTVPAPATGTIGGPVGDPGYAPPVQQPLITQGTPVTSGGPQPNLLPAPATAPPGTVMPMPATPAPAGVGAPAYGTPTPAPPPSGYGAPAVAPPSGYSSPGAPPATTPGSPPPATYPAAPANPSSPAAPGGYVPSTGGAPPAGPGSGTAPPSNPVTTPAPAGSPATAPAPGYLPPGGFNYDNRSSLNNAGPGGNWVTPTGAAATAPVSLDGATVSAPPAAGAATGLNAAPSIIRIPTDGDSGSAATTASGTVASPAQ